MFSLKNCPVVHVATEGERSEVGPLVERNLHFNLNPMTNGVILVGGGTSYLKLRLFGVDAI